MLASFGFPTPGDDWPLLAVAAFFIWLRCRDDEGQLTMTGRVLLLLLVVGWVFYVNY